MQPEYRPTDKARTIQKIEYLEEQLENMNHYLPDTYEYLIAELDVQRKILAKLEVAERYALIDGSDLSIDQ